MTVEYDVLVREDASNLRTNCIIKINIINSSCYSEEENQKPLTSREKEIGWLDNFLTEHLDKEESASLYISGQPGTGKTASLSYILNLPKVCIAMYENQLGFLLNRTILVVIPFSSISCDDQLHCSV